MSQGNLGVCIASAAVTAGGGGTGLVQQPIGGYFQGATPPPGWEASVGYAGCNGSTYYNSNVLGEDAAVAGGLTVLGNSGAASGKLARWVFTAAPLTVGADQTITVSAGGVATAGTAAAYKTAFGVGVVIPTGSFFWVFTV